MRDPWCSNTGQSWGTRADHIAITLLSRYASDTRHYHPSRTFLLRYFPLSDYWNKWQNSEFAIRRDSISEKGLNGIMGTRRFYCVKSSHTHICTLIHIVIEMDSMCAVLLQSNSKETFLEFHDKVFSIQCFCFLIKPLLLMRKNENVDIFRLWKILFHQYERIIDINWVGESCLRRPTIHILQKIM